MNNLIYKKPIVASIMFLAALAGFGQNSDGKFDLLLKFGIVNVPPNFNTYSLHDNGDEPDICSGFYYRLVQFYELPGQAEKQEMTELGLQFIDYIPNLSYVIGFPEGFDVNLLADRNIRSIVEVQPEFKQDPLLLDQDYPEYALSENNQIDLMVTFYGNLDYKSASESIREYINLTLQDDALSHIRIIRSAIENIDEIAQVSCVQFVEPVYPPGEPENYTGKTLHRSNVLDSDYAAGRHYDGTGVNVMLQDDGIIGPHIDYEGRIGEQFLTNNSGDHGDHCAGIIFGAGNLNPTLTGQAPGATLYVYGAAPLYPGFNNIPSHYGLYDIRITSTSYSDGCNAGYTSLARTMDLHLRTYPSLMHVFSAGNDGTSNCGYGAGAGWGNITGGHKVAKNVIATANLDDADNLASSSSRGPAHDGRIKPDISAKGSDVNSTTNPNAYTYKSGTSMACPAISGSLAQLYQAYKELNGGTEPKGGLMKALVMNSADDLLNTGPDFKTGWGRINNRRAVETLEEERYLTDEITQGQLNIHNLNIPAGTKEVKVMVYWTDKEASVGTTKALVNDLDIWLTDPSNNDHLPWLLNHYPHPDSLNKPAVKGVDHLNNVEQVSIVDPAAGSYVLSVSGFQIPFGPQEYYVIYEFITGGITVTYPLGGESFTPGENITVRWDSYVTTNPFTVEYSTDNGANWTTVNSNVNPLLRHFNLNLPSVNTGQALVRVSNSESSDMSDAPFSIMGIPQNIQFFRACPTSVLLKWNTVSGADSYNVYLLGEKYMELVGSTAADSLLVEGISYENTYWFSVSANGPNNATGRRALAKEKSPGVWNCIFTQDVALSDILSPPLGVLYTCQDYNNLNVMIEIANTGVEAMTGVNIYYQFQNGTVVNEVFSGTIQPGEKVIYEFASAISMPSAGVYDMKAWIQVAGDENIANDMILGNIQLKSVQYAPIQATVTFDEFNTCGWDPDCEDISCYIDNKWYNFQNLLNDDIDWRLMNGITPTPNTGPIGDHTTGTIAGRFLYLEASGECYNKKAILTSPCLDLTWLSNPGMIFWFHMYGATMGSLHVDVVSDGILHKDVIDPIVGNFGNQWNEGHAYFADFAGKYINVRFRGYTGPGELSDMAIDDILFTTMTEAGEVSEAGSVTVYPNPSSGKYSISFQGITQPVSSIRVLDITGREILAHRLSDSGANSAVHTVDLTSFPIGIYYLLAETGGITISQKIVRD